MLYNRHVEYNLVYRNSTKDKTINLFFILGLYFAFSFISELIYQIQEAFGSNHSISFIYKVTVILFIFFLLVIKFYKQIDQILKSQQLLLVILFFFINIIASIVSHKIYGGISYRGIINLCLFVCNFVIFYVLMRINKFDKMNIKLFFQFCVFNILMAACYNVLINFNDIDKIFSSAKAYQYSFSSFFSNRNTFAAYLTLGIVFYAFIILWTTNKYFKVLRILACIFILFNLLITLSRTSILGLVIFLLVYFIFTKNITVKKKIKIFVLVFLIILLISTIATDEGFIKSKLIRKNIGNTGRTKIWLTAILLPNRCFEILFGFGSGFSNLYLMQKSGHSSTHNAFLQTYASGGILVLSIYILFILNAVVYNIRNTKNREIKIMIFAFQIANIIASCFESNVLFTSTAEKQLLTFLSISLPLLLRQVNEFVNMDIMEKNKWTKILLF